MKKEILLPEHYEIAKRSLYLANIFIKEDKRKAEAKFVAEGSHYTLNFKKYEAKDVYLLETISGEEVVYRKYIQSPKHLIESFEELYTEEVKSNATLIHYTTIDGLLGILRDGRIKGSRLIPGGRIAQSFTNDQSEIAFTRRSHDRNTRKEVDGVNSSKHASDKTVGEEIRIYVNKEEVLKRVRHAKANKISEAGKYIADSEKTHRSYMETEKNMYLKSLPKKVEYTKELETKARSLFNTLIKKIYNVLNNSKRYAYTYDTVDEIPKRILEEVISEVYTWAKDDYNTLAVLGTILKTYLLNRAEWDEQKPYIRTGEERIYFKKAKDKDLTGIPVDKRFMRIRILPNGAKYAEENKELHDLVVKYQNVFLKDENYKKFLEATNK